MKNEEIRILISANTLSRRNGVYTARRGFFYTNRKSSQDFADRIQNRLGQFGTVVIVDHGEQWKPFKGGASVANQSHWWVTFTYTTEVK
jgi:alpha-amylase/alpha-mannosidase (GH57 family)